MLVPAGCQACGPTCQLFVLHCNAGPAPGASWGVTSLPPGMDPSKVDLKLLAIMRAQQGR